ncbi:MAG TPA: hypothetical protein VGF31_11210, partial [Myxococcaceae bacterium]
MNLRTVRAPWLLLLAGCVTASALAATPGAPDAIAAGAADAGAGIRADAISAHIRFLADDLLEGRAPGDRGFEIAAAYVASQLQGMGLEPAGMNGSWFQPVTFRGARVREARLEVGTPGGESRALVLDQDYVARAAMGNGTSDVTAPVVYVGHGIVAPEYHWDDLAGVDLKGKWALVLVGAPLGTTPDFFPPVPSAVYGQTRSKLERLITRGVAGVLFVQTPAREQISPFSQAVSHAQRGYMSLVEDGVVPVRAQLPQA